MSDDGLPAVGGAFGYSQRCVSLAAHCELTELASPDHARYAQPSVAHAVSAQEEPLVMPARSLGSLHGYWQTSRSLAAHPQLTELASLAHPTEYQKSRARTDSAK